MEISLISESTLRLRGKQVTLLINPASHMKKTTVDATIFFSRVPEDLDASILEGNKIIIDGPGEYEVGGVKITGIKMAEEFYYTIIMDGITTIVGKASVLSKLKETSHECQMALIAADSLVNQTIATALNPNVLLFYGEKAKENITALGTEDSIPISKFVITREKLPAEAQIVLLQ